MVIAAAEGIAMNKDANLLSSSGDGICLTRLGIKLDAWLKEEGAQKPTLML